MPKFILCFLSITIFLSTQLSCVRGQIEWKVSYGISNDHFIYLPMRVPETLKLQITDLSETDLIESDAVIRVISNNTEVVEVSKEIYAHEIEDNTYEGSMTLDPIFLGKAEIHVEIDYVLEDKREQSRERLNICVGRRQFVLIHPYVSNALTFVVYFTLGIAVDWSKMLAILKKPFGLCLMLLATLWFTVVSECA